MMHECLTFEGKLDFGLNYGGSSCKRTPSGHEKKRPKLELAAYENVKIQSLYESGDKQVL